MKPVPPRVHRAPAPVGVLLLAGLAAAAQAQTYSVEIRPQRDDVNVKIETVEQPDLLIVKLTNGGARKVRCDLVYDASPQMPYRTTVYVDPGRTESSVLRAKRHWFRVVVDVKCRDPARQDDAVTAPPGSPPT